VRKVLRSNNGGDKMDEATEPPIFDEMLVRIPCGMCEGTGKYSSVLGLRECFRCEGEKYDTITLVEAITKLFKDKIRLTVDDN
jgi:DnaJ-class molecular chaperone